MAAHRPDAAHGSTGATAHARPNRAMGWPQMVDQGLAGLVMQFLKGGRGDADGQGHSCGEGCAYGLGLQVGGAFSQNAEHDLSHAGVSSSFRLHPWPAEAGAQVRPDTGNRL